MTSHIITIQNRYSRNLKILKFHDQLNYNILIFIFQLKNHLLPISFNTLPFFIPDQSRPHTRQHQLAKCTRNRTTYSSKLPTHAYPRIWNNLDRNLRNYNFINMFKKDLKRKLLFNYSFKIKCFNARCIQCYPR